MRGVANAAVADFPSNFSALTDTLCRFDCASVLANFVHYGLTTAIGGDGCQQEMMPDIQQHHAELLQAIVLTIDPDEWGGEPSVNAMEEVFDGMKVLAQVPWMKYITTDVDKRDDASAVESLLVRMRLHTQGVRNWDYHQDTVATAKDLYGPLGASLRCRLGFDIVDLVTLACTIVSHTESRLNSHMDMIGRVLSERTEDEQLARYYELNPSLEGAPDAVLAALSSRPVHVEDFVTLHSSLFLPDLYTFDSPLLATASGLSVRTVDAILNALALKPGALAGSNPEHLFLYNPVWSRPVVDIGNGQFMVPLVQMVFSHLHLITKQLADDAGVINRLDERRSGYLENEIADVLKTKMRSARVSRNVKWSWQGSEFETDCLVHLDRTLLVVEAKSSRLTQEALRAAPGTLKKLVRKLVLNPSLQSARLLAVVERAKGGDADAMATCRHLRVRASDIDLVIRLSITLDDLSVMYMAEQTLKNARWIPSDHDLPVTMTIHDFKHVVHILDNPIHLFHYLYERGFVQERQNLIADEIDLLGLYLRYGLNVGIPGEESYILSFTGQSESIDQYYNARDAGIQLHKPKPYLRPFFRKIINKLTVTKPPRWTIIGRHVLSCADYGEQKVIEKKLNRLRKIVRRTWRKDEHKCSLVVRPPEKRKAVVIFYLFPERLRNVSRDRAKQLGAHELERSRHRTCCVLIRSIDDWRNPYEAVLLVDSGSAE